ncbi:hypothetical protein [Tardiphaga sp.]|uniref:hypothetical protein n=1 Tax=Tardiphaga sp. TaxID=1926292 RepID=UPI0026092214|nr:hypothetical protein [Tardiphaga sp.]MDB5620486.1 hypothetical protein [Tardiphaga sp.]
MSRFICLSIAAVLSLSCALAQAAPAQKRTAKVWKGYGFLPGYHQPLNNAAPWFKQDASVLRNARRPRRPWYIYPTPRFYGWDGNLRYAGRPGFYRGQYNGGSMGPCWTQTPIGPAWNCGR